MRRWLNAATTPASPRDALFEELQTQQFGPKDQFTTRRDAALAGVLRHAVEKVPHYRKWAASLGGLPALPDFPVLTKRLIADLGDQLYSDDRVSRNAYFNSSGGTTGQPTRVMQDPAYYERAGAQTMLAFSWRGVDPFDRVARLWGARRDLGNRGVVGSIKNFLRNRLILDCFRMTDADMRRYLQAIDRFRPQLLVAYANAAYELAVFAIEHRISVNPVPAVHTSAGMLYPHMREKIEEAFGTKVFNHYGAREVGCIASECEAHNGLHVLGDHVFVEIVDDSGRQCGPGGEGRVLVTSLANYSMPIIRYEIGDRAVVSEIDHCRCGRAYPLLQRVTGRVAHTLRTPSGAHVDSAFFVHVIGVLNYHPNVRRFQVVQRALDIIQVRFSVSGQLPTATYEGIRENIRERIGPEVAVQFETVSEEELFAGGKFQLVVSEVAGSAVSSGASQ